MKYDTHIDLSYVINLAMFAVELSEDWWTLIEKSSVPLSCAAHAGTDWYTISSNHSKYVVDVFRLSKHMFYCAVRHWNAHQTLRGRIRRLLRFHVQSVWFVRCRLQYHRGHLDPHPADESTRRQCAEVRQVVASFQGVQVSDLIYVAQWSSETQRRLNTRVSKCSAYSDDCVSNYLTTVGL